MGGFGSGRRNGSGLSLNRREYAKPRRLPQARLVGQLAVDVRRRASRIY